MFDLTDKAAGGTGIGAAIARPFRAAGARVLLADEARSQRLWPVRILGVQMGI